jgi:hypothetical protein
MNRISRIFRAIKRLFTAMFSAIFTGNVHDQMWTWFN